MRIFVITILMILLYISMSISKDKSDLIEKLGNEKDSIYSELDKCNNKRLHRYNSYEIETDENNTYFKFTREESDTLFHRDIERLIENK